jgi:hypothetical protein
MEELAPKLLEHVKSVILHSLEYEIDQAQLLLECKDMLSTYVFAMI